MTTNTDTPSVPAIYAALVGVMHDIGAISKNRESKFGERYKYRGIDDVFNALQPVLVKHNVVMLPTIEHFDMDTYTTGKGATMLHTIMRVRFDFFCAVDGSSASSTVQGEGADKGDKGVNKAHSSAMKSCVFQALCIPVESGGMIDSETDSPNAKTAPRKRAARQKAAPKEDPPPPANPDAMNNKDIQYVRRDLALARLADLGLEPADGKMMMRDLYAHLGAQLDIEVKNLHDVPRSSLLQIENFIADWAPRDDPPAAGKEVF